MRDEQIKTNPTHSTKDLISSKDAAQKVGFTSDYISKLCRFGKISGKKVEAVWYVDESSLDKFVR